MTHTAIIQGQEFRWVATLPDSVHLIQGGMSDADPNAIFFLNGLSAPSPPLLFDFHYTPETLFGEAHGILNIHIAEPADQDFFGTPTHYADTTNGLRGTINILFHNDLGVPIRTPSEGLSGPPTLAMFLVGAADQTTPTSVFHTPYTHFHVGEGTTTLAQDFPGFGVHGQVGPVVGGGGLGNPSAAPDWILLTGGIPASGAAFWGPLSLHNRDLSPAHDDFDFAFSLLDGALTPADLALAQVNYTMAHAHDAVLT